MPIKGLSDTRRLPRLGKIHLGIKKVNAKGVEYPSSTDYFVCPDEVVEVYGEQPKKLDIIIPVEDEEMWASQYYRQYSRTRGLVCKGDGITCRRMIDTETGDTANRTTKTVQWTEGACAGRDCPEYQSKACQEVMNLQFLLPKVPGLGIWQIDTGSINSIRNINNCAAMVRAVCERVSWIPLSLTLEPTEVVNPDDGKKKVVRCLNLRHEQGLQELLVTSGKARAELLITMPAEDEAPLDDDEVIEGQVVKPETKKRKPPEPEPEPDPEQAQQDIDELWPEDSSPQEPAKKYDTRPAEEEDIKKLKAVMDEAGQSLEDIGKMCKQDLKWKVVGLKDLKVWQVNELIRLLNEAMGK